MPIKFGIKEIKKNMLLHSLVIMLLTVIFVILTFAVTVTDKSTEKYFAICKIMGTKECCCLKTFQLTSPQTNIFIKNKKELQSVIDADLHVAGQYVIPGAMVDGREVNVWSYDRELIDAYTPNIEKGRWFQEKDFIKKNKIYGVAISDGNIKVGDRVEVMDWTQDSMFDVEIIGLIKDGSSVIGYDKYKETVYNYTDFYYTYSVEGEEKPLLLLSNDQLDYCRNIESMESKKTSTISRMQSGVLFLSWMKEEEKNKMDDFLFSIDDVMPVIKESSEDIKSGSEKVIKEQLYRVLPIVICSFILVLLVTVSVGTISVKQQLYNYAIYSLCGLSRNKCIYISLAASFCCSILAFIISHVGIILAMLFGLLSKTSIEISLYSVGVCMIILFIYVGVSIIIPICIIKKKTIKTLLITNRE